MIYGMRQSWSDGYITDLPYTRHYFSDLSPVVLRLACVLKGVEPPRISEGFDYCELGCGHGLTTSLLALAFPRGRFVGIDFNPTHVGNARKLADERGIRNVQFMDASFEEAIDLGLPEFDFIGLHGIISWISRRQRQNALRFIEKRLKVGGLVYVSYNALPGKTSMEPIRLIFKEIAKGEGDPARRLEDGFRLLDELSQNPTGVFRNLPGFQNLMMYLKKLGMI